MQDSMVLSNDERITLLEVMVMLGKICKMADRPNIFIATAQALSERSPEGGVAYQLMLMRLGDEGEYKVTSKKALRSTFTDVLVNMGQVHKDCIGRFLKFTRYSEERQEAERDFIAVDFAEKLIEPELLEKFKPIMFKLGEENNDKLVN